MEASKMSERKGKVAPKPDAVEAAGVAPEVIGDERGSGGASGGKKEQPVGKSWAEVSAILKAAEGEFTPVTHVYVTEPEAEVWNGIYGGAKVLKGDNYAVLSNGKRVDL